MPHALMDKEELQQYILRRLGAPQWKVELTQDDLDIAVEEAQRWFSAKKGFKSTFVLFIAVGQVEYDLPDEADTVLDVWLPTSPTDFSRIFDPLALLDGSVPYNLFPNSASAGIMSTYAQAVQYLETAKRITGAEVEWEQQHRTLFVYPMAKASGNAVVQYKSSVFTIEQLNERDHDLVKRYALAMAKEKLGMVQGSKYAGYPAAQGNIDLQGMRLIQEAQNEMRDLTEELAESGFPLGYGFITG